MLQESFILGAKIPKVKKLPTKFSSPPKTKNTPIFRLKKQKTLPCHENTDTPTSYA